MSIGMKAAAVAMVLTATGTPAVLSQGADTAAGPARLSSIEAALAPDPLPERTTIRFGIDSRYENLLPFWLALDHGEFDRENLDVEVTMLPPAESVLLLAQGELDASVNSVNAGVMNLVAEDLAVRYVFPTAELPPDSLQGIWVRNDALGDDGEFQPADLRGEQILTTTGAEGSTAGFVVEEFTEADSSFEIGDVQFARMAVPDLGPAVMNGAAPAAYVPTPFWTAVRDSGCCTYIDTELDPAVAHILFGPRLLDGDRAVGLAFLRAIARTQIEHLQGAYHADEELVDDVARVLEQPVDAITATPSLLFPDDFQLRGEELLVLQDYFFALGEVLTYHEPLTADDLWDSSWTAELRGES